MPAWGVVAACVAAGGAVGPFLDAAACRIRRPDRSSAAEPGADAADVPVAGPEAHALAASESGAGAVIPAATTQDGAASGAGGPLATGRPATPRRPLFEPVAAAVVTAASWGLAAARLGDVPQLAAYCVLFAALVTLSIVDLRTGLVPRKYLYPSLGLVAVALLGASASQGQWHAMVDALIGGAAGFVAFAAIWWVYPRGMGFGDVRLAGLCGAGLGWLGFRQLYIGFLAGFIIGALMGLVVLAVRHTRRFPFAPAMAAGTAFGVLWGGWLGTLWLHPG